MSKQTLQNQWFENNPLLIGDLRKLEIDSNVDLKTTSKKEEVDAFHLYDRPSVSKEGGICQLMEDGERHQFMIFLLFSGERQYGLLACDIQQEELKAYNELLPELDKKILILNQEIKSNIFYLFRF